MNPIVTALASVVLLVGAYAGGRWDQSRVEAGKRAGEERAAQNASNVVTAAVVAAIQNMQPQFRLVTGKLEKETRVETRYSDPGCQHTPAAWSLLDSAYQSAGGQPFGGGASLPAPAASSGP